MSLATGALVAGLFVVGAPGLAPPVEAYPAQACSVTVTPQTVRVGHTFTVTGSSTLVQAWTLTFNGQVRRFHGLGFSAALKAPDRTGSYGLSVRCVSSAGAQTQLFTIHVIGANGTSRGGGLPNTGGPSIWWLILAIGAILAGSAAMSYRRVGQPPKRRAARESAGG